MIDHYHRRQLLRILIPQKVRVPQILGLCRLRQYFCQEPKDRYRCTSEAKLEHRPVRTLRKCPSAFECLWCRNIFSGPPEVLRRLRRDLSHQDLKMKSILHLIFKFFSGLRNPSTFSKMTQNGFFFWYLHFTSKPR